jgi:hypothetical protein
MGHSGNIKIASSHPGVSIYPESTLSLEIMIIIMIRSVIIISILENEQVSRTKVITPLTWVTGTLLGLIRIVVFCLADHHPIR